MKLNKKNAPKSFWVSNPYSRGYKRNFNGALISLLTRFYVMTRIYITCQAVLIRHCKYTAFILSAKEK